MEFPSQFENVRGARTLFEWFGYWPSFHDAELLSLQLNRHQPSLMAVHTWEMTKETDERGFYVLTKHVVVEFIMKSDVDLSLNGFSVQNVLFGLAVEKVESGYRVTLDDCYGIGGTIDSTGSRSGFNQASRIEKLESRRVSR